ncbi:MAG TPA: glycosyltransferase family 2 protein [Cyclobacteriaceae bacterium]|jgi:glycosyltransferase involved in cell wall biosynthesis|nr:glycosyltransferase family 2 protein [Cyclobacteriaceae bacterium]
MNPLVSVVIPAYNASKYIAETIESVLGQTFKDLEIIVVDDGSTDNQFDLIFPFCLRDARVKYIYHNNQGVSTSRNSGFAHASGKYIAFLDADDIWLPNNLSSKLEKFEKGNFGLVHSDGHLIDEHSEMKHGLMSGNEGYLLKDILEWKRTQIPGPSSILVKREVLCSVGLFDSGLSTSADHDFFLRVASNYAIGRVAYPTWKYRLHENNMHKNIRLMEKDVLYVYKKASANNLFNSKWFEKKCYATMYMILAASWAGDGSNKLRGIYFGVLALLEHPHSVVDIGKRILRKWTYK